MRRREFIIGAAVTTIWPPGAIAQHSPPVVGFLSSRSPIESKELVAAFNDGLKDAGFTDGQNVRVEYRWAEGAYNRLPGLASDFVNEKVTAIVTVGNTPTAHAARDATKDIPIIFVVGDDPVKAGLVDSLARPHGNLTGITVLFGPLAPKRFEVLSQLIPTALSVGLLMNPNNPGAQAAITTAQEWTDSHQLKLVVQGASAESELAVAFDSFAQQHIAALVVDADPFFTTRREKLITLAAQHSIPTMYPQRDFVSNGGLVSYGGDLRSGYRSAGTYVGRIIKGAKAGDLPVQQSTRVELIINLKAAKALGLDVPTSILLRADEVIE
jgi:putative tryptophan/tyrosine transport system substrate-binding protein